MFKESKYTACYFKIVNRAKFRKLNGYTEKHHIIPKCLGGNNESANIVRLTAREHFICHKLLTRMVTGQARYKMLEALAIFANNRNRKLKLNSRDIAMIRESNATASSIRNKGNQHYLKRAPASNELKSQRSKRASKSRWVNNGIEEKFTSEWHFLINSGNFKLGRLKFSKEWREKIASHVGHLHTAEVYEKKSQALRGRPKSKSHRENLSKAAKNRVLTKFQCPHCFKSVDSLNYERWHGEKCKTINQT